MKLKNKVSEINRKNFIGEIVGGLADIASGFLGGKQADDRAKEAWEREKNASAVAFNRSYGAYKRRYQDTMPELD